MPDQTLPWMRIESQEIASLLADPATLRFLAPFVAKESSASDAARALGVSLNRLLYWLKRFEKLGLVRVVSTDETTRAKRYRTVADVFFVPFQATKLETAEAMFEQWNLVWQPVFYKNLVRALAEIGNDWGVRLEPSEDGLLRASLANTPQHNWNYFDADAPPIMDGWITDFYLDFEDAKALQREMLYLYLRYAGKGGKQRYMARVSFAPMLDTTDLPFSDRTLE
jgi:Helix-turn-helix domain